MAAVPILPEPTAVLLLSVKETLYELQNLQKYRAEHHKQQHQKQERRSVNVEIDRNIAEADELWHNALTRGKGCGNHNFLAVKRRGSVFHH